MFKEPQNGYFALVLVCAVCLAALALVSWTVPYSKGYQRADQDHQSAYATHDTAEEYERKCSTEITIENALSCYRDAYNTDREQERAEEDLDAQREMANWAEGMLWATVAVGTITAGVTALGVWYVAQTLSATSATLDAARIANQIMRDEQRPWLKVDFCNPVDVRIIGDEAQIVASVNIINLGKMPAKVLSMHFDAIISPYPLNPAWSQDEALKRANVRFYSGRGDTAAQIIFPNEEFPKSVQFTKEVEVAPNPIGPDTAAPEGWPFGDGDMCASVGFSVVYQTLSGERKTVISALLRNSVHGWCFKRSALYSDIRADEVGKYNITS